MIHYFRMLKKRILGWIHSFFRKLPYTQKQRELFEMIKPGDFVYARMPFSNEVMKRVPEGHKNRPYLIVKKNEDTLVGYPSYHKKKDDLVRTKFYQLKKEVYKYFQKNDELHWNFCDSYLNLTKFHVLPIENLFYKSLELNSYDLQEIERKLCIEENNGRVVHHLNFKVKMRVGDICCIGNAWWYVYQVDKHIIYTHPVYFKKKTDYLIEMSYQNSEIFIDCFVQKVLMDSEQYSTRWYFTAKEIKLVEHETKQLKHNLIEEQKQLTIDYSFRYSMGQILVYSYSEEEVVYLYSIHERSYGVRIVDEYCELIIIRIKDMAYLQPKELLDSDVVYGLLTDLIEENKDIHGVLRIILNKSSPSV